MPLIIENRPDYQGKLIRVPVKGRPGAFVKITEEEAIARGLLPALKKRELGLNKKRRTSENKTQMTTKPSGTG